MKSRECDNLRKNYINILDERIQKATSSQFKAFSGFGPIPQEGEDTFRNSGNKMKRNGSSDAAFARNTSSTPILHQGGKKKPESSADFRVRKVKIEGQKQTDRASSQPLLPKTEVVKEQKSS